MYIKAATYKVQARVFGYDYQDTGIEGSMTTCKMARAWLSKADHPLILRTLFVRSEDAVAR
jgi:hypothetical protein